MIASEAGTILKQARTDSGLSQRQLAHKAGTAQSQIARTELGDNSPAWDTLMRLLHAAGFTLRVSLERIPAVNPEILDDVPRILAMTPQQRLEEVAQVSRFVSAARRV